MSCLERREERDQASSALILKNRLLNRALRRGRVFFIIFLFQMERQHWIKIISTISKMWRSNATYTI